MNMKQIPRSDPIGPAPNRFPFIFRSILAGFLVSSTGIATWSFLLFRTAAPWCVIPMVIALWAYLNYFNGSWGPERNREIRKTRFRLTRRPSSTWTWGLLAAMFFVLIIQSSFVITFRILEFPASRFTADYKALDKLPIGTAWIIIIMSSLVAGICEETGFRGYMQVPLEKRFGPAIGIIITSIVFTLIHLSHSWAVPILPHVFFASLLLGTLAYKSGSLIPGIIGHSILDVFDYAVWWSDITGGFHRQTIEKTGIDFHFVFWILIFILALFLFFMIMDKLKLKNSINHQP
jgi:membrane protease YdiL (CAAX protease family)